MERLTSDTRGAAIGPAAASEHGTPGEQQEPAAERPPHDDTTLAFDGLIKVADEDIGGDPYNRTGRFKRAVR
jgi:hypothetical protein